MNCCFMLNLSPNLHGRIDENLMGAFSEIGRSVRLPQPLKEIPGGWMKRNTQEEREK